VFFSRSQDAVIRVYDEAGNVIETHEYTGDFRDDRGFRKGLLGAREQAELSAFGERDSARKEDCLALSGGNRFVRPLLTASSVIAVMPACMLTAPNPSSRSEWPAHCDGGIHYVWPRKLGAELVFVFVFAIAAHIPRKQKTAPKQHY